MTSNGISSNFHGSFIWTDRSSDTIITPTAQNQTIFRSSGGFTIYSNSGASSGVTLSANGGSWTSVSDRNAKDNIIAVDPRQILRGVLQLPISTWNYKGQQYRHIGAMAQDFYKTFNVGENDKTITTVDPDGVALAAIQGLNEELKDELKARDAKIDGQKAKAERLETQIERQQKQIDELKQIVCSLKPDAAVCKDINK